MLPPLPHDQSLKVPDLLMETRENKARAAGFTLTELLVVISVIAVMLLLAMPIAGALRQRSTMVHCASNLRQAGVAVAGYLGDHKFIFPDNQSASPTFIDSIRPYLGEGSLHGKSSERSVLVCPGDRYTPDDFADPDYGPIYYSGSKTSGYALSYASNGYIKSTHATYGTGNTPASIERPSECALIMDFEMHFLASKSTAKESRVKALARRHNGKMNVLYVDGHVGQTGMDVLDSAYPLPSLFWQGR